MIGEIFYLFKIVRKIIKKFFFFFDEMNAKMKIITWLIKFHWLINVDRHVIQVFSLFSVFYLFLLIFWSVSTKLKTVIIKNVFYWNFRIIFENSLMDPVSKSVPISSIVHGTCPAKILMSRTCPGHVPSNVLSKKLFKITNNKIIKNFEQSYLRQYWC